MLERLPYLTIKIHNHHDRYRDQLSYLPDYACYKSLCRLNQQLHPPSGLGRWQFPLTDPEANDTYCMRLREVTRLEELFAPLLQSGTFSAQLVLELRDGVAMQWSV